MILENYISQRAEMFLKLHDKATAELARILNHLKRNGLPDSYGIQVSQEGSYEFYDEDEDYDGAPSNWGLGEILKYHLLERANEQ